MYIVMRTSEGRREGAVWQAEELWNDAPSLGTCLTFHPLKITEQREAGGAGDAKRQTTEKGVRRLCLGMALFLPESKALDP